MKSLVTIATTSALLFLLSTQPAHAYLDPGSGSLLLQILLGGLAGLAIAGKLFWRQLLDALGIKKRAADVEPDTQR